VTLVLDVDDNVAGMQLLISEMTGHSTLPAIADEGLAM